MKKTMVLFFLFLGLGYGHSQIAPIFPVMKYYFDLVNWGATTAEARKMKDYAEELNDIEKEYRETFITSVLYDISRTDLEHPIQRINFNNIRLNNNPCDQYITFTKKNQCNTRLDYLEESYDIALEVLNINPKNDLRNGMKEQIWEKYASICNVILKDIRRMQSEASDTYQLRTQKYKQ